MHPDKQVGSCGGGDTTPGHVGVNILGQGGHTFYLSGGCGKRRKPWAGGTRVGSAPSTPANPWKVQSDSSRENLC